MIIAGIVVAIIVMYILLKYNKLVKLRNAIKQARSGIDIYLNQRFDLIPNLVECVNGYTKHEKEILENVTKMRSEYIKGNKSIKSAEKLNDSVNGVLALAESYPELKSSEQFLSLQNNLQKVESQLQAARRIYNSEVTNYNNVIQAIPANIVAAIFGFKEEELFQIEEYKRENIDISKGLN